MTRIKCLLAAICCGLAISGRAAVNPVDSIGVDYEELPDTVMLEAVTVTARKPVVVAKGDRVVFNAEEDNSVQDKTLIDLLRKVPMVAVDGNNNVTINGQSNFQIYVNGKPSPMLNGSNRADVLKSMPASMVKKVEVITEPGAKYDAEGTGGVLNLITESTSKVNGQSATLQLSLNNNRVHASVNALVKRNKVMASLSYNYMRDGAFYNSPQTFESERENLTDHSFMVNKIRLSTPTNMHFGNFELSYEPDSLNLFTVSVNGYYGNVNVRDGEASLSFLDSQRNPIGGYTYRPEINGRFGGLSASTSYQHTFRREGHHLIASYLYNHGLGKYENASIYLLADGAVALPTSTKSISNSPSNEHTVQLDYTLPFGAGHSFEAGAKALFRRSRNSGEAFLSDGVAFVPQPSLSSAIRQSQDIGAVYATATGVWRNWSLKGGVRYEYTRIGVDFLSGNGTDFASHLNDVVPNASITYSFSDMSNLHLSYQMRISRPSADQMNPYRNPSFESPMNVSYGNPHLSSERNNTVTLTYSNFGGVWGGNISAQYTQSDNLISQYMFTRDGILYSTFDNIGARKQAGLNGYLSCSAVRGLRVGLSAGVHYSHLSYPAMNISNDGWFGDFNINADYSLPWNLQLSGYGGMSTRTFELQETSPGWHYYGLSLSRSFLKGNPLRVSLSANSFFEGHTTFKFKEWGKDFVTQNTNTHHLWSVGVTVSYRFGTLQSGVKQTAKSIINDDLNSAGASTLGSASPN